MQQYVHETTVETGRAGAYDITEQVVAWATAHAFQHGLLTLHSTHSGATLCVHESPDFEPSRGATTITLPIVQHRVALGADQCIFVHESGNDPAPRRIVMHAIGAPARED